MKRASITNWIETGKNKFGTDPRKWKYVCPNCGTVLSLDEFNRLDDAQDPYLASRECVGNYNSSKGCTFRLLSSQQKHNLEIVYYDEVKPVFEYAS